MRSRRGCLLGLLLISLAAVGCQPQGNAVDPAVLAQHRERLVLAEEPEGAVTPLDLRGEPGDEEEGDKESGFAGGPVVLVGQIGGMPNPWSETEKAFPWVDGEATFFLVDPATVAEFADHATDDPDHHENCPFCARAAEKSVDAIATVTFVDKSGKPIGVAASELFDLKANDMVVVRGEGRLLAENHLFVEADGIYVRR